MRSKPKWADAAKKELEGKDPDQALSKLWDEFTILPYYQASDVSINYETISGKHFKAFDAPNSWYNLPEVVVSDQDAANAAALHHLKNGGDGISFKVEMSPVPEKLLKEIKPEFCFIGFEAEYKSIPFFEGLAHSASPSQLSGAIFWKEVKNWLAVANLFRGYNSFRYLGITEEGETASEQIFSCLKSALIAVDQLTDYAFPVQSVFNQIAFSVNASHNFFGNVIKIRALRLLVSKLASAYGLENTTSFIRMKINPELKETYEPHGDLLSNGIASIAAVASSVDAITVVPTNSLSELHSRTARNISLLLKEESKLDKVIDPFAGSYFVESMTNALVEKVWSKLIQEK